MDVPEEVDKTDEAAVLLIGGTIASVLSVFCYI